MNWADSSDDESDDELHPARLASSHSLANLASLDNDDISYDDSQAEKDDIESLTAADSNLELAEEKVPYPPEINFDDLPPNFPTEAPYTAYIRNVAFNIKEPQDLANKIEGLVKYRYQGSKRVKVANARLGFDHETGKRRGFGYAEFETAKELMIFLNINDNYSQINGRAIVIDIAKSKNNRNNNNRRDNNRDNRGGRDNRRNNNADDIDGSRFRGGIRKNNGGDRSEQRSRPSLKLAPRSKPVEGNIASGTTSTGDNRSGDGDRDTWRAERNEKGGRGRGRGRSGDNRRNNSSSRGGGGGRGRKGGGRNNEGKSGGRGGNNNVPSADGWGAPSKTVIPSAVPAPVVEEKKKVTKVSNAFAALGFDSDSD